MKNKGYAKKKVSVVIPIYRPEKEVFERVKEMLKKQTIKAEIVEKWNNPEAVSMNLGIKEAKGEIIIILAQDCIPENEFWLEKLIKPLEDKKIVATVSDLFLPEKYWKKYPFMLRLATINERNIQYPTMDMRACAYRKKDLMEVGLISEDPKIIGLEADLSMKLKKRGKFARANVKVLHLHKQKSFRGVIDKLKIYSEGNGKLVRRHANALISYGENEGGFWHRILRSIPIFGFISIICRFPFRKYPHLFPIYLILIAPLIHIANITGFWEGFLFDRESERNKEVLRSNLKNKNS